MIFVSLPITTYFPDDKLEDLGIEYEPELVVRNLNVRLDHIQMYIGMEDGTTEVWLTGHERAHTVVADVKDFESKIKEAVELFLEA